MRPIRRSILRPATVVLLLLLPWLAAGEAAAFGDCGGASYFANTDRRYAGEAVDCVEAEVFSIDTPEGPRQVRIVHEAGYPASDVGIVVAEVRRGIEAAEAGLLSIGEGGTDDVTVFASMLLPAEGAPAGDDETEGAAVTAPDGCRMIVYPGVVGRADLAYLIAHEFFHCVQYATQGRVKTMSGGNAWWVEGSAEWFAALSFPASTASDAYVAGFDAISHDTPLTSMDYDSVVFFFWLSQNFGPSMVMALMDALPVRAGAAAQQAAVLGLLSEDDLLRFAQDYLDREIRRPGGGAIASHPFPGDIYVYDETRQHRIEADAFVLARAQLEFACGRWTMRRNHEDGRWRVKKPAEDWMEMPEQIEVAGPAPETWRLAAFGAEPVGFRLLLEAERDPCRGCEGGAAGEEAEARSCLIGGWELLAGGYGEMIERQLREQGILETVEYPEFFVELTIRGDGSYETYGTTPHRLTVRNDEGELHTLQGDFTYVTAGKWSLDGEEILFCEVEVRAEIDDEMIDPDGDVEVIQAAGGPDSGPLLRRRDFTCAGGSLVLVEDIPMTPTVTWTYGRR